jgi:glycosyltransferase involved in cell wall biosynthesis
MPAQRPESASNARVVFLVNFLSPNLVNVFREVDAMVGKLDVLVSIPMEANRNWKADHEGVSVTVQKTWTKRKLAKHPGGYTEELFVHLPLDTSWQLKRLKPDCVVSLEMGLRSVGASVYRHVWDRHCRHVLSIYGSERSEAGRGGLRRWLRRRLLSAADVVTYNGPSCKRYLLSQGAPQDRMLPWDYAADPAKPYRGELFPFSSQPLRLLTISQLIPRKGVLQAADTLAVWARSNPQHHVQWAIAGTGPDRDALSEKLFPSNVELTLCGHCDIATLQQLYASYPVNFFPTLGDEWGLVVDEALASGQLVLGSTHSQAVETLIRPGENGWKYNPDDPPSLLAALDQWASIPPNDADRMREQGRLSVAHRTHVESAQQFVTAVDFALRVPTRSKKQKRTTSVRPT